MGMREETPVRRRYDVIVAGGGPSGVAAAVAAARNGSKTLLIEREACLGGMASLAGVPAFGPFTNGVTDLIGGIGREILEELKKESYVSPFYDRKSDRMEGLDWYPIDPEILKRVLDRLVTGSGCDVLFYSVVTEAACFDGEVKSVRVFHKGSDTWFDASYFIDCTGDGDLAHLAGAAWDYGDELGRVQSGTLCFRVAGIDTERFMNYAREEGENGNLTVAAGKAKKDGCFPEYGAKIGGIALQAEGVAGLNFGHVYDLKPLDPWDLSRAEIEARGKLPQLVEFLQKYVPGMEHCVLVGSGPYLGVRESRRIRGRYKLTKEDYDNRADFPDSITHYSYPIDIHPPVPGERNENEDLYKTSKYKNGEYYGIPYRCLLPEGLKNLAVAGRIICADRAMMASVRIMSACFSTGQAAGTAAAVCVKAGSGMALDQVDMEVLRKTLPMVIPFRPVL